MSELRDVPEHEQSLHIILEEEIPDHIARTESELFAKNKRLLVHEHDLPCIVPACKTPKENREVHHLCEWSGAPWYDFEYMKILLMQFDVYGFSKMYHDQPIISVDDLRNLAVICSQHHRTAPFAIHRVPFPQWVQEAVVKDGHSFIAVKDHLIDLHKKEH